MQYVVILFAGGISPGSMPEDTLDLAAYAAARHILVCALTAKFLNRFLSNLVWSCISVNSRQLLCLVMLPPVFVFYRVKGHILKGG